MTTAANPEFQAFLETIRLSEYHLSGQLESGVTLRDSHGFLMEHEEALDVVASILYFYRNVSPETIKQHNQETDEKWNPSNRDHRATVPKSRKPKPGYVYLLESPTGAYKIGVTSSPESRIKKLGVKLPFEVAPVCLIQTDDMYNLERQLHDQFSDCRLDGEWFNLTADDVNYIKSLAGVAS